MEDMAVRMFALKLVVSTASEERVANPFPLADAYYKWLTSERKDTDKPKGSVDSPVKTSRPPGRKR